jgi:hypothetical protein
VNMYLCTVITVLLLPLTGKFLCIVVRIVIKNTTPNRFGQSPGHGSGKVTRVYSS